MTPPLDSALLFLVNSLFGLYLYALILRTLLQLTRADFYNPVAQFVWRITHPPVVQLQRLIPYWRRLDVAALVFAYLVATLNVLATITLAGASVHLLALVLFSVFKLAVMTLNLYSFCIFVQAILSWVGQGSYNSASALLWSITEPVLHPVRARLPPMGGLDLSPLVVLLVLQVLVRLIPLPMLLR